MGEINTTESILIYMERIEGYTCLYTASGPIWPIDVTFNCQRPIWPIDVFFNCQRADWADLLPPLTAKGPIGPISIVTCIFFIK